MDRILVIIFILMILELLGYFFRSYRFSKYKARLASIEDLLGSKWSVVILFGSGLDIAKINGYFEGRKVYIELSVNPNCPILLIVITPNNIPKNISAFKPVLNYPTITPGFSLSGPSVQGTIELSQHNSEDEHKKFCVDFLNRATAACRKVEAGEYSL